MQPAKLSDSDFTAQLFSDAAHDLAGPMNQVAALVSLLAKKHSELLAEPASAELMDHIQSAVRQMRTRAEGLRVLSQMLSEPMSPERLDTNALLSEAARGSGVELSPASLPQIEADPKRMAFVFRELIANAAKFRGAEPPRLQVHAHPRECDWLFEFHDNGAGFDARSARDVFRIFRRLEPGAHTGSGVGLTLCRLIVEKHRGEIWAESEPGKGATISFSLPRL